TKEPESETKDIESETKEPESETKDIESETKEPKSETKDIESETKELEGETREDDSETKETGNGHTPKDDGVHNITSKIRYASYKSSFIDTITQNPNITYTGLQDKFQISRRKVNGIMKLLIDEGVIERVGGKKNGIWIIKI
ncbi:MAG: winged helix-turn-helix domain-containing protein, partial [Clostridia bacterium]|nr:winged helix-turn-helix domain-containing protein [Clostridia bacterium]